MNSFDDILRGNHQHEPPPVSRDKIKKALRESPLPTGNDMNKKQKLEQAENTRRQLDQQYLQEAVFGDHTSGAAIAAGDQAKAALEEEQALANRPKRWRHLRNK